MIAPEARAMSTVFAGHPAIAASSAGPSGGADRDSCGSRRPNASTTSSVTLSSTSIWTVTP